MNSITIANGSNGGLAANYSISAGQTTTALITSKGLTFGTDRKFGDNKFFGLALRYGGNKSNIIGTKQNAEMESLTLNFYGVIPKDEDHYINAVLGLSALRFDQKYLDKLTGERNGKQIFTAINFRSKKIGTFKLSNFFKPSCPILLYKTLPILKPYAKDFKLFANAKASSNSISKATKIFFFTSQIIFCLND